MKQVGNMKLYSLAEMEDEIVGSVGTEERDRYEHRLSEEMDAWRVGEAIRQARKSRNMTQEQLGERLGVKKAQISRLESGKSITLSTLTRLMRALEIPTAIDFEGVGRVALC